MGKTFSKILSHVLEAICRALGNIREGLSETDINKYLNDCKIDNPTGLDLSITKPAALPC